MNTEIGPVLRFVCRKRPGSRYPRAVEPLEGLVILDIAYAKRNVHPGCFRVVAGADQPIDGSATASQSAVLVEGLIVLDIMGVEIQVDAVGSVLILAIARLELASGGQR